MSTAVAERITLTQDELRNITGCVQPAAQARWLKRMYGIDAPRGADGRVKLPRWQWEQANRPTVTRASDSIEGPNWGWQG